MADAPKSEPTPKPKTVKPKAPTAKPAPAAPKRTPKPAAAPAGPGGKPVTGNPYAVIYHPVVTEKTMFNMDKNNSLEFLVAYEATKPEIKKALEDLFTVKIQKVTTRVTKDGKRAVVRFAEGYSAEDIGMRIGVF